MEDQHVYHHNDPAPDVSLKAERLQKGWNTTVSVTCNDPDKALALMATLTASMTAAYPSAPAFEKVAEKDKTKDGKPSA